MRFVVASLSCSFMSKWFLLSLPLASALLFGLQACGSSSSGVGNGGDASADGQAQSDVDGSTPSDVDGSTNGNGDDASSASNDAGNNATDASLEAPIFEMLKPNDAGTLTLTWTNVQPDCDGVEASRKDGLNPYAVVFTAAGTDTTKTDPGATQNFNYTYKLRCTKGADVSPYSFELSANPHN